MFYDVKYLYFLCSEMYFVWVRFRACFGFISQRATLAHVTMFFLLNHVTHETVSCPVFWLFIFLRLWCFSSEMVGIGVLLHIVCWWVLGFKWTILGAVVFSDDKAVTLGGLVRNAGHMSDNMFHITPCCLVFANRKHVADTVTGSQSWSCASIFPDTTFSKLVQS